LLNEKGHFAGFLNLRNSIVDLEWHEVMFVDRSGEGALDFIKCIHWMN